MLRFNISVFLPSIFSGDVKAVCVESIFNVVWKDGDGEWDHKAIIITIIST